MNKKEIEDGIICPEKFGKHPKSKLSIAQITFWSIIFLVINIATSCSEQTVDDPTSDPADTELPDFKFRIYGATDLTYNAVNKSFTYKFVLNNTGNIGILMTLNPASYNPDLVFDIGYSNNITFVNYSKTYIKNEFRFGEKKLDNEVRAGTYMTIEVIGIISGSYSNPPNCVRLHNLLVYGSRHTELNKPVEVTFVQ